LTIQALTWAVIKVGFVAQVGKLLPLLNPLTFWQVNAAHQPFCSKLGAMESLVTRSVLVVYDKIITLK
jgi:hypothetical protein